MKLTNEYNVPQPLYDLIGNKLYKPHPDRLGVTTLVGPPLIHNLMIKHWDELTQDVSEFLWMLLGTSVDYILSNIAEKAKHEGKFVAVQLKLEVPFEVDGKKITVIGKPDFICDDSLEDWKVTSVWSIIEKGVKPEWDKQLNCYAYLYNRLLMQGPNKPEGMGEAPIRHLCINAILRDHDKNRVNRRPDDNYPPIPFVSKWVGLWAHKYAENFIYERVVDHVRNPWRECTPEEKWQREPTFALMKKGRKSAIKVEASREAIVEYAASHNITIDGERIYVEERKGECVRCNRYCPVAEFCPYFKKGDE